MDRRKALKNIGISFGSITLSTSIVSIVQSCQTSDESWTPVYFDKGQLSFVEKLMEVIIPETDTPGAISLKLIRFTDSYLNVVLNDKDKESFKDSVDNLISDMRKEINGEKSLSLVMNEYLTKYLDKKSFNSNRDQKTAKTLEYIRRLAVDSYKINEYVMTNILSFQLTPGQYKGCADLDEFGVPGSIAY